MQQKILIADDDQMTVDLIRVYLEKDQYQVITAYDGKEALRLVRQEKPDLVILDWMLPEIEGTIVCRTLRTEGSIPMIMLTARSTEEEKLLGLDLGVDDYVTKPFSPRELVARVRIVLRRMDQLTQEKQVSVFCIDDLFVDFQAHEVKLKDKLVCLTPKEFKLLEVLAREAGKAFSRSELVNRVFGLGYEGLERTIDVHLMNLRKKIEPCPEQPTYLQTVYGIGYKLRK